MKKILLILILTFWFKNVFSLPQEYKDLLNKGCMDDAQLRNNLELSTKYCKCYVNNLAKNNPNAEKFLEDLKNPVSKQRVMAKAQFPCLLDHPKYKQRQR